MKRRGFLQALFGAPAAAVAGVAVAKLEKELPKAVESEPAPEVAETVFQRGYATNECSIYEEVSLVVPVRTLEEYSRSITFTKKELLG